MITTEHSTGLVEIRGQKFARFGRFLADLTPFDYTTPRGDEYTCAPTANEHGNYTATFPDEGRSRLLCRFTNHTRGQSHVGDGPFRWIFADEENATNQQISERTADMLDTDTLTI